MRRRADLLVTATFAPSDARYASRPCAADACMRIVKQPISTTLIAQAGEGQAAEQKTRRHLKQRIRVAIGLLPGLDDDLPDVGRIEEQERRCRCLAAVERCDHSTALRREFAPPALRGQRGRARRKGAGCRRAHIKRPWCPGRRKRRGVPGQAQQHQRHRRHRRLEIHRLPLMSRTLVTTNRV